MSGVGPRSANKARHVPTHPKGPTPLPRRALSAPERESRGGGAARAVVDPPRREALEV